MTAKQRTMHDLLGDSLWAQWRELGVPANAPGWTPVLVDIEALAIATARFTDGDVDDRIRDGAITWLVAHWTYVSTPRLTRLLQATDTAYRGPLERLASQVDELVPRRLGWPKAPRAVPAWRPSTDLTTLDLWAPSCMRLRCRSIFGTSATADAVASLASHAGGVELAVLERDTGFSRARISDGLVSLVDLGWVASFVRGRASTFALTDAGREVLRVPLRYVKIGQRDVDRLPISTSLEWVDWMSRFHLHFTLVEVEKWIDLGDILKAFGILAGYAPQFQELGHPVPEFERGSALEEFEPVLREWLVRAAARLAGQANVS
ncbi:MAG: hypothetical protein JWN41_512 [Thermoleophilia bacterium]|nr:hypothetical protein [Thermoleophilia bacterium]